MGFALDAFGILNTYVCTEGTSSIFLYYILLYMYNIGYIQCDVVFYIT